MTHITAVSGAGVTVSSMAAALAFYTGVLPFRIIADVDLTGTAWSEFIGVPGASLRVVTLALGGEQFSLTHYSLPSGGRPIPHDSRSNDLWFQHIAIVVSDMDAAYARLREHGIQHVSTLPQTLPAAIPAAAGIRAFYFRDPDGHNLELIWYPPGKGDARWQGRDALFLGIDHTAISVRSTAVSLRFYRDQLGLSVLGESFNFGSEQEHLNAVFGAHVHITGLKAASGGMGIEFLEYLAPPGGRPMPPDTRANDLWHWETTLLTADLDAAARALPDTTITPLPAQNPFGWGRALTAHDPDGHTVRLVEEAR